MESEDRLMTLSLRVMDGSKDVTSHSTRAKDLKDMVEMSKEATIDIARDVLKEEQSNGFDKKPRVRTDNVFDKPIINVKAFGKIEYFARQNYAEAIQGIYTRLLALSPVGQTRYYKNTHFVLHRGKTVATDASELKAWLATAQFREGDVVRFVNAMPYARKLELNSNRNIISGSKSGSKNRKGKTGLSSSGSGAMVKKPNGAYYLTYRYARSQYKSVATFIKFAFLTGDVLGIDKAPIRGRQPSGAAFRTSFKKDKRPYLYPTIVLDFSQSGVLQ